MQRQRAEETAAGLLEKNAHRQRAEAEAAPLAGQLRAVDSRRSRLLSQRVEIIAREISFERDDLVADERRDAIAVRYGPERRYDAGRIPSWIEWSFSGSVVRLKVEDHAPADPAKIRYAPPAEAGWTILSLDAPGGRSLVRWLLGLPEGSGER